MATAAICLYLRLVPRKRRSELPGGWYHVTTRGNNKTSIYVDERDRRLHLWFIDRVAQKYGWVIYAYCLMGNHFHLVLQIGVGGLSKGMCELNGGFSLATNLRAGRENHLFGKRFWSEQLESDRHLLECCRYVALNPCRAGLCADPADYAWSSYRATVGLENPPAFLAVGEIWRLFSTRPGAAREAYRTFVEDGRVRCQAPSLK